MMSRHPQKDIFGWGRQGSLADCAVVFHDAPLFDYFGINGSAGTLFLRPEPAWVGIGLLECPSEPDGSRSNDPARFDVEIRRGALGAVIDLCAANGVLRLSFQFGIDGTHRATVSLDFSSIVQRPSVELYRLRGLGSLLQGALAGEQVALRLLEHPALSDALKFKFNFTHSGTDVPLRDERHVLMALEALGVLQTNFGFQLSPSQLNSINGEEAESWVDIATILKGHRVEMRRSELFLTCEPGSVDLSSFPWDGTFHLFESRDIRVQGKILASFPVRVVCENYRCEPDQQDGAVITVAMRPKGDTSNCYMTAASDSTRKG